MDALLHPGAFALLLMEQTLRHRGEAIFQVESVRLAASWASAYQFVQWLLRLLFDKFVLTDGLCLERDELCDCSTNNCDNCFFGN